MNRFFRNSRLAAFLLATILAGGAMVAWGFFAGLTGVTLVLSRVDDRARESLYVTVDGRPVIQTISGSRNVSLVYRSLDRQVIPKNELSYGKSHSIDLLHAGHLAADTDAWDAEISRDWMRGYSDGEEMPKYWYLVREGDTSERAYLVGYDAQTLALVGFLGARGFRTDKPVAEDQFDFGARSLNCTTASLTGSGSRGRMPGSSDEGGGVLALACADQLYCIDLGRQTVDHVALPESAISVAVTKEPRPEGDDLEEDVRLVVRTPEHVLVLDWDDKILRKIPIPTPLVGEEIQVNLPLGTEVVLAETRRTDGGPPFTHELYWVDKDGRATRHESVKIADLNSLDIPSLQIAICAIPSPSALAAIGYLLTSTASKDVDVSQVRRKLWNESWRLYMLVCLLSAVLAAVAFRHQRRYEPRTALAWALFVFLLGPAGLLGYLAHRRWPALDECAACGAQIPRNGDACRACQAEFPVPALLGGEVFA